MFIPSERKLFCRWQETAQRRVQELDARVSELEDTVKTLSVTAPAPGPSSQAARVEVPAVDHAAPVSPVPHSAAEVPSAAEGMAVDTPMENVSQRFLRQHCSCHHVKGIAFVPLQCHRCLGQRMTHTCRRATL